MSRARFTEFYPAATIERRRTTGYETYYLIRERPSAFMPYADGKTPGEAWGKAWSRLVTKIQLLLERDSAL